MDHAIPTPIVPIKAIWAVESALIAGIVVVFLFTGPISGAVADTLQIFAQRATPPAEAALILSLESVFAAVAGRSCSASG